MATWDDVRELATALVDVDEEPELRWRVRGEPFVFARPLRPSDRESLGREAPDDVPLAAWVPDLGVKDALLADAPDVFFTTPHFDGYRIVLARLDRLEPEDLVEVVTEAWLARAPVTLARRWLAEEGRAPHGPAES